MEEQTKKFIETILEPSPVESLYGEALESGMIEIMVFETPRTEPRKVTLTQMFPFMTILDIKLALYHHFRRSDRAHPDFVFLGKPREESVLETTDFTWSLSATPTDPIYLANLSKSTNPLIDARFVDSNGTRKAVRRTDTERMTIEDKLLKSGDGGPIILHAYFYEAIKEMIPGERPIGERDWNGCLYPYFPKLTVGADTVTSEQRTQGKKLADNFIVRRLFYLRIEEEILKQGVPVVPVNLSAVRYLRLIYTKPTAISGIEVLFYEVPVNERRPYMRLIPVDNSPISKVHMLKDSNAPNLEDPRLLYYWSQEKSPTPDRDFGMVKILLRKRNTNAIPLYATMRLFDDGTADITLEPPKPLKKLDPVIDLNNLGTGLADALTGFPYLREAPLLKNGNFIFSLNIKDYPDIEPYTTREFQKKLPIMSAIFQEIPSLEGDNPMITLRYKLVSNFGREDRIQTFITQLLTLKPIKQQEDRTARIKDISDEFQISLGEAAEALAKKLQASAEIILANPETKDYAAYNNPGIDITIFSKHPLYYFNVYRADSYETIQRIITFLSILFSIAAPNLKVSEEEVKKILEGERASELRNSNSAKEDEEEEEEEEEGSNNNFKSVQEAPEAPEAPEPDDQIYVPPEEFPDYMADMMQDATGPTLDELQAEADMATTTVATAATVAPVTRPTATPRQAAVPAKGLETYFSEKLKEADRTLFDFNKTHPDLTSYVTQCGANLMRQPAVLTADQFKRMEDEYTPDIRAKKMRLFVFPLEKTEQEAYPGKMEYYTIMRYGSAKSLLEHNYYLCSKYFCVRDEMLVREVELNGPNLRPNHYVKQEDGTLRTTKLDPTVPSCPMCEGRIVQNRRFPGVNETVIERNHKNGRHLYIRFLRKTNHPDGLYLPCCFLEDQPLRIGDPQFPPRSPESRAAQAAREPAIGEDGEEEPLVAIGETYQKVKVSYEETLLTARTASIVGVEKMPLNPAIKKIKKVRPDKATGAFLESKQVTEILQPQIGLLPNKLNEYFSQNTIDLASRTFNPQKLKPNSKGFLRIGVENRSQYRADSFLAAIAPFFRYDTVEDLKGMLYDIIQPRLFMGLNFGNLLLEMYDPTWVPKVLLSTGKQPTRAELRQWAYSELKISKLTTSNEELVLRAYLSYDKFVWWLYNPKTIKEYRQFAHFLSLPGILPIGVRKYASSDVTLNEMRRPGIIFIVLDILESGEMKVRCPSYPVGDETFKRCDVGFLLHHYSGIWEPIFYYNNDVLLEDGFNQAFLTFSLGQKVSWPDIVEERLKEFRTQCSVGSGSMGVYTSSRGLRSNKVVPLIRVKNILSKYEEIELQGLLRDSYNHVAALVYKTDKGGFVAVPVIEDGISHSFHDDNRERLGERETGSGLSYILDVKIVFDWDDFKAAPLAQVIEFYKKYVEPSFSELYKVERAIKNESAGGRIEAVQLKNGLYIPVSPPDLPPTIPVDEIQEMEWKINKQIVVGSTISLEELHNTAELRTKEFNETFEHLRITFSNWLNSKEDGGNFRRKLEGTISNTDLPLYERRKRMEIMIAPIVEKWFSEKSEDAPRQPSLLRVDCRLRSKEECNNACSWSDENGGKCLIHVRKMKKKRDEEAEPAASAGHILMLRLVEELLRFGNRRREIFEQRVSQLAVLDEPIRQGDQYIIPEKTAAWTDLLRSEWQATSGEKPLFLEEMRQEPKEQKPLAAATPITALPVFIESEMGADDPLTGRLRLYPSPTGTFEPFMSLFNTTAAEAGLGADDKSLSEAVITKLVRKGKIPVVQYDLRTDPPSSVGKQLIRDLELKYAVFVIAEGKPPSLIVTDTEHPEFLKRSELPAKFVDYLKKIKKTFGGSVPIE